jgi:hypothetical protein
MEKLDIEGLDQDGLIMLAKQKTIISIIFITVLALFLGFYTAGLYLSISPAHYNLAGLIKFITVFGYGIAIFFSIKRELGLFIRLLGWFWASTVTYASILFILWL